jgi:hypothetical protein
LGAVSAFFFLICLAIIGAQPLSASVVAHRLIRLEGKEFNLKLGYRSRHIHSLSDDLERFQRQTIGLPPILSTLGATELNRRFDLKAVQLDAQSTAWYIKGLHRLKYVDLETNPNLEQWLFRSLSSEFQVTLSRLDPQGLQKLIGTANVLFPRRERLLIENRYHFQFPPLPAVRLESEFSASPYWIEDWIKHTGGRVYRGGYAQFNSLLVDKTETEGKSLFPLLLAMVYSHGVFSTGSIIEKGESRIVGGVRVRGPALILPEKIVLECLEDGRKAIFQKLGFRHFGTFEGNMHVMEADLEVFVRELPGRLKAFPGYEWVEAATLGSLVNPIVYVGDCGLCNLSEHDPFPDSPTLASCVDYFAN